MGTINDRISEVVEDSGLTQTKFAERVHVVQSHISALRMRRQSAGRPPCAKTRAA